jgi:hypothetical protein
VSRHLQFGGKWTQDSRNPSEDADDFQNLAEVTDKYDNAAPGRQKSMKMAEKD